MLVSLEMFDFADGQKLERKMVRRWVDDKLKPRIDGLEGARDPSIRVRLKRR